ncbi:MAG TPA: hypothetical protein PLL71_04580 [Agriterribacter sp.]|nr:hypothetical protein [Agriterribacter sp.]
MRFLLLFCISFFTVAAGAQTTPLLSAADHTRLNGSESDYTTVAGHLSAKKWFVTRYSALSTGLGFFNGGSANFISIPLGLQLNRRLNNNWYAFAGISAAPSYVHFNQAFRSFGDHKTGVNNRLFHPGAFGVYSRAEMGLMYINEDRTFSISGSIGVQRSSYPLFPFRPATKAGPVLLPVNQ